MQKIMREMSECKQNIGSCNRRALWRALSFSQKKSKIVETTRKHVKLSTMPIAKHK